MKSGCDFWMTGISTEPPMILAIWRWVRVLWCSPVTRDPEPLHPAGAEACRQKRREIAWLPWDTYVTREVTIMCSFFVASHRECSFGAYLDIFIGYFFGL